VVPLSTDGVAVDAERFVMAYLGQWYTDMGAEKTLEDPPRFVVVKRVTGAEDMISDYPILSVHSFNADYTSAKDLSLEVHAHMKALTPKTEVVVNGITYGVDHRCVEEAPHEVDYDDKNLRRFVARYELGLRLL
jgi:hypothetical protein